MAVSLANSTVLGSIQTVDGPHCSGPLRGSRGDAQHDRSLGGRTYKVASFSGEANCLNWSAGYSRSHSGGQWLGSLSGWIAIHCKICSVKKMTARVKGDSTETLVIVVVVVVSLKVPSLVSSFQ